MALRGKRQRKGLEQNTGQWHTDIECIHSYTNGEWVIIFTQERGHYDSYLGVCVKASLKIKAMPQKKAVLENGLGAFLEGIKKAQLVMRNSAL